MAETTRTMPRVETYLAHAGLHPDPATGALVTPLYLSTTFERAADGSYPHGYVYSRMDHPNRRQWEETMALLEGGESAVAFASGMAAIEAVLRSLHPGDHVLLPDDVYHGVRAVLREVLERWGLTWSVVEQTRPEALEAAARTETRMLWIETPSNPMLKVVDIAELAARARASGWVVVVDNTWSTPLLQQPLALGADIVVHSTTKYLNGHSDVLGGVAVFRHADEQAERVRAIQVRAGSGAQPFDCWLTLRGIRTLAARMRIHCDNARRIAAFLESHPRVQRVYYPGLPSHPGHTIARRQMEDFGGMLSFQVKGGEKAAMEVVARTRIFTRATSLGGTESLIEHRASIEGPDTRTPRNLIRLSVGLEHWEDLVEDLTQALGF